MVIWVGGALIAPMQKRWEGYLTFAEAEAPKINAQANSAPSATDQAKAAAAALDGHAPAAASAGRL